MNEVFRPFLRKFVLIFFDDILVYSRTKEEHSTHLQMTLAKLSKHKLYAKGSKCSVVQRKIGYLGHLRSQERVEADLGKISCML